MFEKAVKAIDESISELKKQIKDVTAQIAQLEAARAGIVGGMRASGKLSKAKAAAKHGSRTAKSRALQSLSMKASWAARRAAKKGGKPGRPAKATAGKTVTKGKKATAPKKAIKIKRKLSPAARKALSARMKAKWAAFRAQKKAA